MKYYQESKQFFNRKAEALNRLLESKRVKKIKRFIIILFATLILLDVIFVLPNKFPTISRVVLLSSPKNLFLIWLWGVTTANLFFPRKIKNPGKTKIIGSFLLIGITAGLIFIGLNISQEADDLTCADATNTPTSFYTEIICYTEYDDPKKPDDKVDCAEPGRACDYIRIDITTPAKATLIIVGMLFGYLLWPQLEREEDNSDKMSSN